MRKGDRVEITSVDGEWARGVLNGKSGDFPLSYVEILIAPDDAAQAEAKIPTASTRSRRKKSKGNRAAREADAVDDSKAQRKRSRKKRKSDKVASEMAIRVEEESQENQF